MFNYSSAMESLSAELSRKANDLSKEFLKPITNIRDSNPGHTISNKSSLKGRRVVVRHRLQYKCECHGSEADTPFALHHASKAWTRIVEASIVTRSIQLVRRFVASMMFHAISWWVWHDWRQIASQMSLPKKRGRFRSRGQSLKALTLLITIASIIPPAEAVDVVPYMRVGCGFTAVGSAISLIPLRRDERVGNGLLISMYVLSLACTTFFIQMQYLNIVRFGPRYLFGTFCLAVHFLIGLSQTSNNTLEGVVDFGPVILPLVAAVFSVLFQRRRSVLVGRTYAAAAGAGAPDCEVIDAVMYEQGDMGLSENADIGLQDMPSQM
ncbi:hypothetical protein GGR51DRAFT_497213 [Nemania sp. FL0031]|nr:hypothetical protein GGR51DRAFT_497213 [Nemania sp. FL0031]